MEENMVNNGGLETSIEGAEGSSGEEKKEKMFTQEQVNEIIKKRLERQKENNVNSQELEARAAELTAKESRLDCREYLINREYPVELLDLIDTSDVKMFKEKADKMGQLINRSQGVAPLANLDVFHEKADAFTTNSKHQPKGYWATDPRKIERNI